MEQILFILFFIIVLGFYGYTSLVIKPKAMFTKFHIGEYVYGRSIETGELIYGNYRGVHYPTPEDEKSGKLSKLVGVIDDGQSYHDVYINTIKRK